MSKTILFFADGTWNGPGQDQDDDGIPDPTNVFKLFCNLDGVDAPETTLLAKEQEKILRDATGPVQVAKYLHGVGDSRNFLVKFFGGTGGAGLVTRIVRGYTFVSRNYETNDRIFLVGFSRGAYTARALAGLISTRGLLDATKLDLENKEQAYRLGAAVWYDYRREALSRSKEATGFLHQFTEIASDLPGFLTSRPTTHLRPNIPIDAVAVWDTVGALGIPQYTVKATRVDAFQFANRKLSDNVRRGLHAVAVDEQRADFTPTLWDDDSRVIQALFPGAHSDVGGGYPSKDGHCGLSDGALRWMMDELSPLDVRFAAALIFPPRPDFRGVAHQPWRSPLWEKLPTSIRRFVGQFQQHGSLRERMQCGDVVCDPDGPGPYKPTNLPA